ncbi:GNAT family N-acetyltransferase [Halalkalibacter alkalisediminis]|uniref:GNAT family N-acetyltransferase n=1 Tax=Halalkalibacter alkalisediminis TaxID=935616 RepID=A0ABV6NNW3_9BACI|nr:GNAT family N-acetyltransferase [Halalkalibacter alkalisediminis]
MQGEIKLKEMNKDEREVYIHYLLLADDSTEVIKDYMNEGDMFAIFFKEKLVGTVLFTFLSKETVELKNIALEKAYRGRGLGKATIEEGLNLYKKKQYQKMVVGTANSSIDNIAFYQKVGFRMDYIKKDFFHQYPNEIYENGIKAQDMIMFIKDLTE